MAVTAPFKVKCESCELIFVINDLSFVGKQISCRRCKYQFKIPKPPETRAVAPHVDCRGRFTPSIRQWKIAYSGFCPLQSEMCTL